MSSRDEILNKIKTFQSDSSLTISTSYYCREDIIEQFIENAKLAGATMCEDCDEEKLITELSTKGDFFIYESSLGVAENGALWCSNLGYDRKKLFLCNDLIIKIKKSNIRSNMHEAYEQISFENREFGTFIAGPSKTADIEQSLVLGAHGAMSLYIYLMED